MLGRCPICRGEEPEMSVCRGCAGTGCEVHVTLSVPAARFLVGCVEHLNTLKALPEGSTAALETSAWLEEIAARTRRCVQEVDDAGVAQ